MIDEKDKQLDAIVGSAIRALVEAGTADDAFLGAFAASHRVKVAQILGQSSAPPEAPDLVDLVAAGVAKALMDLGLGKTRKATARRVWVTIAGKRTSVTVNPAIVDQLAKSKGGVPAAEAMIRELAARAPAETPNRSGWIEQQVQAFLTLGGAELGGMPRH